MVKKNCQFVLVGHHPKKLILSIDKTIVSKVIFVTEKDELPGTKAATKALEELINYYKDRKGNTRKNRKGNTRKNRKEKEKYSSGFIGFIYNRSVNSRNFYDNSWSYAYEIGSIL
ncbi:unnamed protein product [marine sediment metagenome]|uniref:Uncharacterized protein n=1 Tax=marine sediment metagenome TaxID=412755 RepID=X1E6K2_9ZZZZ